MARVSDPALARAAAEGIVRRLREGGHIAYFAGGCVRDELLGLRPTDYDIATDATPQRVRTLFPRSNEVGAAFGVMLIHVPVAQVIGQASPPASSSADSAPEGYINVEVATFRSDGPYSDARRPDAVHFSDPKSDAIRRDFTINALYLDPLAPPAPGSPMRGEVIDFVGGVADLHARILRAVGDPHQRLAEDHLRALRAVRFTARLGFSLDEATADAIRAHAAELRGVSRERIGEELRRMLAAKSRAAAIELLQRLRLDAPALEEPARDQPCPVLAALEFPKSAKDWQIHGVSLAAWAVDRGLASPLVHTDQAKWKADVFDLAGRWRKSLSLSNDEREALHGALSELWSLCHEWLGLQEAPQKRLAQTRAFRFARWLCKAWEPDREAIIARRVDELEGRAGGIAPEPFITGDDLIALGLKPGPRFKKLLDEAFDAQLEGRVRTREEAILFVRGRVEGRT